MSLETIPIALMSARRLIEYYFYGKNRVLRPLYFALAPGRIRLQRHLDDPDVEISALIRNHSADGYESFILARRIEQGDSTPILSIYFADAKWGEYHVSATILLEDKTESLEGWQITCLLDGLSYQKKLLSHVGP